MQEKQQPPLYATPTALWQAILQALQPQVSKITFDTWLIGSTLLPAASTLDVLTVAVRNSYACDWLTYRMHPVVARTAVAVAGKPVVVFFIPRTIRSNECDNSHNPTAPVSVPGNDHPVTGKEPASVRQPNQSLPEATPGEGKTAVNTVDVLRYGGGTLVDAENVTETTTFRQFVAARNEVPASKAALVDFYRQRV